MRGCGSETGADEDLARRHGPHPGPAGLLDLPDAPGTAVSPGDGRPVTEFALALRPATVQILGLTRSQENEPLPPQPRHRPDGSGARAPGGRADREPRGRPAGPGPRRRSAPTSRRSVFARPSDQWHFYGGLGFGAADGKYGDVLQNPSSGRSRPGRARGAGAWACSSVTPGRRRERPPRDRAGPPRSAARSPIGPAPVTSTVSGCPVRPVADRFDVLPGLGHDGGRLEQHAEDPERRVHRDERTRLHPPALGHEAVICLDAALGVLAVPAHVPLAHGAARTRNGVAAGGRCRPRGLPRRGRSPGPGSTTRPSDSCPRTSRSSPGGAEP